jgi:hypothetical protein
MTILGLTLFLVEAFDLLASAKPLAYDTIQPLGAANQVWIIALKVPTTKVG